MAPSLSLSSATQDLNNFSQVSDHNLQACFEMQLSLVTKYRSHQLEGSPYPPLLPEDSVGDTVEARKLEHDRPLTPT